MNVHLLFSPLSRPSRIRLWQQLLSRLPQSATSAAVSLSSDDFERLGSWELNGREIQNTIKTVRTWCVCKGYRIDLARLESAIAVTAPQARMAGGADENWRNEGFGSSLSYGRDE